jgi:hypothetical protein
MMYDRCYMLEKPFMGAVINVENIFVSDSSYMAPTSRDNCSTADGINGLKKYFCEFLGVVNDNTSEPNVDWCWTVTKKGFEFGWRCIFWWLAEEEAAYI